MVVNFPVFTKVTLNDKHFFDEFNKRHTPYADWAFGTLMTWWDAFDDLEASVLEGNIVIKSSYLTMGDHPRFTLLGNTNIDKSLEIIIDFQRQNGLELGVFSVPQYTFDEIARIDAYITVDDLDAAEYISNIKTHINLEGSDLYHIRRAINRFNKSTQGHSVDITHVQLNDLQSKLLLINSLHTWHGSVYDNDRERLEGKILDHGLLMAEIIGLESLCVFVDKKLAGFSIYKPLHDGYANINHIKVSPEYPNLFRYMNHLLASNLEKQGYTYLNGEQDLGIEGLRNYKTSLRPFKKLHKYNLIPIE